VLEAILSEFGRRPPGAVNLTTTEGTEDTVAQSQGKPDRSSVSPVSSVVESLIL
jgi:hypothetical protein